MEHDKELKKNLAVTLNKHGKERLEQVWIDIPTQTRNPALDIGIQRNAVFLVVCGSIRDYIKRYQRKV